MCSAAGIFNPAGRGALWLPSYATQTHGPPAPASLRFRLGPSCGRFERQAFPSEPFADANTCLLIFEETSRDFASRSRPSVIAGTPRRGTAGALLRRTLRNFSSSSLGACSHLLGPPSPLLPRAPGMGGRSSQTPATSLLQTASPATASPARAHDPAPRSRARKRRTLPTWLHHAMETPLSITSEADEPGGI